LLPAKYSLEYKTCKQAIVSRGLKGTQTGHVKLILLIHMCNLLVINRLGLPLSR